MRSVIATVTSGLLLGTSYISVASAQTAPGAPDPAPAAQAPAPSDSLGDIVVTARKKNESLTTVPLAITALTGDAMAARGIKDIADIAAFTPGLRFQNQSVGRNDRGFKQYIIRGIVPNTALSNRQTVTIFVDGAPVSGGNIGGVTDIEQVETIKGPQSAFFGRSTFAGAINFITKAPSFTWGGNVDLSYERFNARDMSASLEGPIVSDVLSFRVSGRDYHTDGAYKDATFADTRLGRRNTQSVSGSLLFTPTSTLRIRAFATHWEDNDGLPANARYGAGQQNCNSGVAPAGTNNYFCGTLGNVPTSTATWNQYIEPTAYAALAQGVRLTSANFLDHLGLRRIANQYRANVDWKFGDGWTATAIGSISNQRWTFLQTNFGLDTRLIPNVSNTAGSGRLPYVYTLTRGDNTDDDKYAELHVSSPQDKRIRFMVGASYLHALSGITTTGVNASTSLTTITATTAGVFTPLTLYTANTTGIFGSVAFDILPRLTLSGEGRYQWDKQAQDVPAAGTHFAADFKSFAPRVILNFKPTPNSSLYASYSEGNRPGEFNGQFYASNAFVQAQVLAQTAVQGVVPEDKIRMEEIGYKAQLFGNRVRVLATAYHGIWSDRHIQNNLIVYQNAAAQAAGTGSQISLTAPAGRVKLSGAEFELDVKATSRLLLEGTFNVANTKIGKTYCTDCLALTGNPAPVGTQLPFYPKYSGTASATYNFPLGSFAAYARGDMIYTGKIYETEDNFASTAPAATFNLRVGVEKEGYRVELYGKNLFNNKTATSIARVTYSNYTATGIASTINGITASLPDPVTYGVRVSKKF